MLRISALGAVADDLEVVGAQFRAMMPAVIAADLAPDLRFSEILDDLGEELGAGLPEWIEAPDGDDFVLGPETSSLVLEWDWTMEQAKGVGLAAFLDEWRDVEERLTNVSLHEQSIRDFVMAQPEPALRDFLKSVTRQRTSPRWSYAFDEAYGVWAKLVRELTSRWDPALFAATSRANIVHDWTLALPLVKDAIAHKRIDEAATLIDEAVRVRLQLEPKEHWDPRTTLLAHAGRTYLSVERDASTRTLLGLWKDVAEARREGDLVAALTVQLAVQAGAERGDAMLKALGAVPPRYKAVREALFGEWRRWFVARTLSQWRDTLAVACGAWVAALVDAAAAGDEGTKRFHAAVRDTLAEATTMKLPSRDPQHSSYIIDHSTDPLFALAVLTLDLDAARPTLAKSAPRLLKLLKESLDGGQTTLDQSRRRWIARLDGASLLPEFVEFWRENAARFVPDPGGFTSNYAESADWLAALHELNPGVAAALLSRWAGVHRLKRNLWRDLAKRGLHVSTVGPASRKTLLP